MTNTELNELISEIEKAAEGSSLRLAIINALKAINDNGGNALTFNGHYADYFAWRDEFLRELRGMATVLDNFDDNPKRSSVALIQSGNLKNYLDDLMAELNEINGGTPSKKVSDAMIILNHTKELIAEAIRDQGGTIEDLDTFEDYAKRIKNLNIYNLDSITITENGTQTSEHNQGWNVVNVDVKPKVEPKLITADGEYEVPEGIDAWNPVTIQVPGARSKDSAKGGSGSSSTGTHSTTDDVIQEYAHLDIDQNGTYSASEQQKQAIGSVSVNVTGIDPSILSLMNFEVTFVNYDGTTLHIEPEVRGGSAVIYPADKPMPTKPSDDGTILTFSHWDPMPTFVDHNMTCTAVFTEALYSDGISHMLTWEDVLNGGGKVGDILMLNLQPYTGPVYRHTGDWSSWDAADTIYFGPVRMRCVSQEEAWTTWVSMDLIQYDEISTANARGEAKRISITPVSGYYVSEEGPAKGKEVDPSINPDAYNAANKLGWLNSPFRVWLNTDFLNQCIPTNIRNKIVGVTKTFYNIYTTNTTDTTVLDAAQKARAAGYLNNDVRPQDGTTALKSKYSKVWIPSNREIWQAYSKTHGTKQAADQGSSTRSLPVESEGLLYSAYGEYLEPEASDWTNNKAAALKYIYYTNNNKVEMLKHLHYYPYSELETAARPWLNQYKPAAWPTRTYYNGQNMVINAYGNSKNDMSKVADEELKSNTVNLAQLNNRMNQQLGICFGFCIGST